MFFMYPGWLSLLWMATMGFTLWGTIAHQAIPQKGAFNFWQWMYLIDVSVSGACAFMYVFGLFIECFTVLGRCHNIRSSGGLAINGVAKRNVGLFLVCGIMFVLNIIASYVGAQWYTASYCMCWYVSALVVYHPKASFCGTFTPPARSSSRTESRASPYVDMDEVEEEKNNVQTEQRDEQSFV